MATQFESQYRLVGAADNMRRMALYDIVNDDSVWVNTVGYGDEISETVGQLQSGNVVDATVTDKGGENEYWNLLDISLVEDTRLYYFETDGYTPGPTDDFWETEREGDDPLFTAAWRDDNQHVEYEIQLQKHKLQAGDEVIDVFDQLQRGEMLTEPLFEGDGCDYIENSERILVTNPQPKPYLGMYLFPQQNQKYDDIYEALYNSTV